MINVRILKWGDSLGSSGWTLNAIPEREDKGNVTQVGAEKACGDKPRNAQSHRKKEKQGSEPSLRAPRGEQDSTKALILAQWNRFQNSGLQNSEYKFPLFSSHQVCSNLWK